MEARAVILCNQLCIGRMFLVLAAACRVAVLVFLCTVVAIRGPEGSGMGPMRNLQLIWAAAYQFITINSSGWREIPLDTVKSKSIQQGLQIQLGFFHGSVWIVVDLPRSYFPHYSRILRCLIIIIIIVLVTLILSGGAVAIFHRV